VARQAENFACGLLVDEHGKVQWGLDAVWGIAGRFGIPEEMVPVQEQLVG